MEAVAINSYATLVRLAISTSATNSRGPQYCEQALAAIHQANHERLPIALGFVRHADQVTLSIDCPEKLAAVVRTQLYAAYPDAKIVSLADTGSAELPDGLSAWTVELSLHPDLFPIKRYPQFEDALNRVSADPLSAVLTSLAAGNNLHGGVEIVVRPAGHRRRSRSERCLRRLATPFFRRHERWAHLYPRLALSPRLSLRLLAIMIGAFAGRPADHEPNPALHASGTRLHDREDHLQAAGDKLGKLLFEAHIHLSISAPQKEAERAKARIRAMAGAFGQFSSPHLASFHIARVRRSGRCSRSRRPRWFLLSTEELATLWHPPTQTVKAPSMSTVESRELEPPVTLPTRARHPDVAVLGLSTFRSCRQSFGLLPDDRRRHLALLGKTGMGKSTLLFQLLCTDIAAGRGVALIDPHGDLCETVLRTVPRHRTNDVILFDVADSKHPLAFNLLQCPEPSQRPLVASGILSAFKKLYGEFWGPRLEHILRNALLALLEVPGSSLLSVLRLLSDARFRKRIMTSVSDPVVRGFWEQEFARLPQKLKIEAVAPIQNKVGHFVSSPLLRNILGQARSTLNLRRVMDEGKVLLVNLSKGRLGDDASSLLGSLLVTAVQLAAMSRADQSEEERRDFYLSVDEFQNFATESFGSILSEARKYRLNLTIANQYLAQMDEATLHAVFGNVGTLVCFQVGAKDAELLAEQLGREVDPQDLLRLPRYQAYCRLLIDGHPSRPFSMQTLPLKPRLAGTDRSAVIRRASQERYGRPALQVEREILVALGG